MNHMAFRWLVNHPGFSGFVPGIQWMRISRWRKYNIGTPIDLDSAQGKAAAMSTESRIVSTIPVDFAAKITQLPSLRLLTCDIEGQEGFVWPGNTTAPLKNGPDKSQFLEELRDTWRSEDGFDVKLARSPDNAGYDLEISGPDEASYFVGFASGDRELSIDSFSPCFPLADGNDGGYY